MSFWNGEPEGYTLIRADGTIHNRIRGDLIDKSTLVISEGGRYFVRTGKKDDDSFLVYKEGFGTFNYASPSA